eukprot:1454357-Amphidinium_carterae.1
MVDAAVLSLVCQEKTSWAQASHSEQITIESSFLQQDSMFTGSLSGNTSSSSFSLKIKAKMTSEARRTTLEHREERNTAKNNQLEHNPSYLDCHVRQDVQ